jgi:hypothetical protein
LPDTPTNLLKSDAIDLTAGIKKTKKAKFKFEIEDDSLDEVDEIFSEIDIREKTSALARISPMELRNSEKDKKSDIENQKKGRNLDYMGF